MPLADDAMPGFQECSWKLRKFVPDNFSKTDLGERGREVTLIQLHELSALLTRAQVPITLPDLVIARVPVRSKPNRLPAPQQVEVHIPFLGTPILDKLYRQAAFTMSGTLLFGIVIYRHVFTSSFSAGSRVGPEPLRRDHWPSQTTGFSFT